MRHLLLAGLFLFAPAGQAVAGATDDINAGYDAFQRGDHTLAIDFYTRGIESGQLTMSELAIAYGNRCSTNYSLAKYERAALDCATAIELDAEDAVTHNLLGTVQAAQEDIASAAASFDTAIELDPDYAEAYNNRGLVQRGSGEVEKAVEDFATAIWLKPDYAQAYLNRGETFRREGLYDRAIADFDTAIGLSPRYPNPYIGRGAAYQAKGSKDRAIADYKKAQTLAPDDPFLKRKMSELGLSK